MTFLNLYVSNVRRLFFRLGARSIVIPLSGPSAQNKSNSCCSLVISILMLWEKRVLRRATMSLRSPAALEPAGGQTSTTSASASSNRPRPLSMPPSSADSPSRPMHSADETTTARRRQRDDPAGYRARPAGRILGDYTLTKTLGAGSMGKVKLATHNITGEKVCLDKKLGSWV